MHWHWSDGWFEFKKLLQFRNLEASFRRSFLGLSSEDYRTREVAEPGVRQYQQSFKFFLLSLALNDRHKFRNTGVFEKFRNLFNNLG